VNPADTDSAAEGVCSAGPTAQHCSLHSSQACTTNAECEPPSCPSCATGETCVVESRQCFVNGTIFRSGAPGTPEAVAAATFCLASTGSAAFDTAAGAPGPGALTQPLTFLLSP